MDKKTYKRIIKILEKYPVVIDKMIDIDPRIDSDIPDIVAYVSSWGEHGVGIRYDLIKQHEPSALIKLHPIFERIFEEYEWTETLLEEHRYSIYAKIISIDKVKTLNKIIKKHGEKLFPEAKEEKKDDEDKFRFPKFGTAIIVEFTIKIDNEYYRFKYVIYNPYDMDRIDEYAILWSDYYSNKYNWIPDCFYKYLPKPSEILDKEKQKNIRGFEELKEIGLLIG